MNLDVTVPTPGGAAVATLRGEWDAADVGLAKVMIDATRLGGGKLVADLVQVDFVDSSVVNALVRAYNEAQSLDGWVRIVYRHHSVGHVLDVCGLSGLFPRYNTVAAALHDNDQQIAQSS
jgi:anti-anti-sigma factor